MHEDDPGYAGVYWGLDKRTRLDDGTVVFEVWFGISSRWSHDLCPTIASLCRAITYRGPAPDDVIKVVRVEPDERHPLTARYMLFTKKKCPVLFTGGGACPMCGEIH